MFTSTDPSTAAYSATCLEVVDASDKPVLGRASIGREERSWRFVPSARWVVGGYALQVDPRLEDLAGNSLLRLFDRDLTRPNEAPVEMEIARIMFQCDWGPTLLGHLEARAVSSRSHGRS